QGDRVLRLGKRPGLTGLKDQLQKLVSHSAVYGSADVVSQVVNLLLTPLYVKYLSPADYGVLAVLFLFSAVAKLVFRMGLDSGFFRIHYEIEQDRERRAFTFSVACFAALAAAGLFALVVIASRALATALLGDAG